MSSTSPSLVASLQAEIIQLRSREASLTRIAAQALVHLREPSDKQPLDGIWVRDADRDLLAQVQEDDSVLKQGGPLSWGPIVQKSSPPLQLVTKTSPSQSGFFSKVSTITPFRSAFPLEILEYIVTLAGPKAVLNFARASFGCLQVFGPRLYRSVTITKSLRTMNSLFATRRVTSSVRLSPALSLHVMQTLDVTASALQSANATHVSPARLSTGPLSLRLLSLVVRMDFDCFTYVGGCENSDCDDSDCDLGEGEDMITLFRPSPLVLSLLDPVAIRIERDRKWGDYYRITQEAATIIASWNRLRKIRLIDVDLFVLGDAGMDEIDVPRDDLWDQDRFFLCPPGFYDTEPAALSGDGKWAIQWNCTSSPSVPFFGWDSGWADLPEQLALRDRTLLMSRIESATILVRDERTRRDVQAEIEAIDADRRGPLRVEVRSSVD